MSRVGRMPIDIPAGVTVKFDGPVITVKGPNGELTRTLHRDMKVTVQDNVLTVERPSDEKITVLFTALRGPLLPIW